MLHSIWEETEINIVVGPWIWNLILRFHEINTSLQGNFKSSDHITKVWDILLNIIFLILNMRNKLSLNVIFFMLNILINEYLGYLEVPKPQDPSRISLRFLHANFRTFHDNPWNWRKQYLKVENVISITSIKVILKEKVWHTSRHQKLFHNIHFFDDSEVSN